MKIEVHSSTLDSRTSQIMRVDGHVFLYLKDLDENPKEAIIGQGIPDCELICALLAKAYDAGVAGEEFNVEYSDSDDGWDDEDIEGEYYEDDDDDCEWDDECVDDEYVENDDEKGR
jgi:hypothetical protein